MQVKGEGRMTVRTAAGVGSLPAPCEVSQDSARELQGHMGVGCCFFKN